MAQLERLSLANLHSQLAGLSPLKAGMLSLVSGVLTIFAFAPFNVWPIYVFVITLQIWLLDGARQKTKWRKAMFTRGWLFGAGFTLASMHWTAAPFLVNFPDYLPFIWLPIIVLPAGLGLFFGFGSLLAGLFWSPTPARVFVYAIALALTEWLRGKIFGGFPWNWPGTIWVPGGEISQLASIVGLWGLSFLTLLFSATPAALADYRSQGSAFARIYPGLVVVIIFAMGWAWGLQRLDTPETNDGLSVRMVDVGVPQDEKYPADPDLRIQTATDMLITYLEAMGDDFPDEPRLVVWPEAALPLTLLQDPNALDAITSRLGTRTLIVGTARVDRYAEPEPEWYNSLAVLTAASQTRGAIAIYDKHRLVPFGELAAADFIPFGHSISAILPGALQQMATAGFKPGPATHPIELPSGETFLPLICYEVLFPDLVQKHIGDSDFLVNISIDAWFGGGIGPAQHFLQARYRAIENGRPLVRVANLGMTAAIDAFGREERHSINQYKKESWKITIVDSRIENQKTNTIYSCFGNITVWLILGLTVLNAFILRRMSS